MPKDDEECQSLSERCKAALEKRYGFEIPLPDCLSKKAPGKRHER